MQTSQKGGGALREDGSDSPHRARFDLPRPVQPTLAAPRDILSPPNDFDRAGRRTHDTRPRWQRLKSGRWSRPRPGPPSPAKNNTVHLLQRLKWCESACANSLSSGVVSKRRKRPAAASGLCEKFLPLYLPPHALFSRAFFFFFGFYFFPPE